MNLPALFSRLPSVKSLTGLGTNVPAALQKPVGANGSVQLVDLKGSAQLKNRIDSWPLTGQLYAIGDSQTYGTNSQAVDSAGTPITAANRIFQPYRWVDILASSEGRTLVVNNIGRPGQKISDQGGFAEQTVWHGFGLVPTQWTGVLTMMLGYNNLGATPMAGNFFQVMERASKAFVARAIIEDYAGIGVSGMGSTGLPQDGFTTTGANLPIGNPAGESNLRTAFYYGNSNGPNLSCVLAAGQYVQFTANDKQALGLFLRSSNIGGNYVVTVNGEEVAAGSTAYVNVGGGDPTGHQYPLVEWLENLPASAVIRLAVTSGSVIWQAYGSIPATGSVASGRLVIIAGPTGNQANSRADIMLQEIGHRVRAAAQRYEAYGVMLADPYTGWNSAAYDQVGDESHFTEAGNKHVAAAFARAGTSRRPVLTAPVSESTFVQMLDHVNFANMDPATWGVNLTTNGGQLSTPNSVIGVRCGPSQNSTIIANEASAGGTSCLVRPTHVMPLRAGNYIDWTLPFRVSLTLVPQNQTATGIGYINFASFYNNNVFGPLSRKGFGLKIANNALQAQLFGTALTNSPNLEILIQDIAYQIIIQHLGGGNYEFSVNGRKRWVSSVGPTGNGAANSNGLEISATNGATTNYFIFTVVNLRVFHTPITTRY
jgi:hypothetical protein